MKKIKFDFKRKDKKSIKIIIIAGISVILLAIVIVLVAFLSSKNQEKKMLNQLENSGRIFYENFFWEQIGSSEKDKLEILKNYEKVGIVIDLENIIRFNAKNEDLKSIEFKNKKTKQECDRKESKVIIFPKDPYGKKDYKIEAFLECGFKK